MFWVLLSLCWAASEALLPFREIACTRPFLRGVDPSPLDERGVLRPRTSTPDADPLTLGVMEKRDIPAVARLIANSFSSLSIDADVGSWEHAALERVSGAMRAWDFAEFSLGLRVRCGARLRAPERLDGDARQQSSVVLALSRCSAPDSVAAVELCVRDADGSAPFTFPLLDRLDRETRGRREGDVVPRPQPYLSNLCVSPRCRRRGVARALVDATEFVAGRVWGYDSLFLHVHPTNTAARELYERAGYELVRDQRSDSSELLYYSKQIDARRLDDDDGDTI